MNDNKAALASGDLVGILASEGPDESYRCRYEPVCPNGHDHSDHAVTLDLFRWGSGMWMVMGDGSVNYADAEDVADAVSKLARMAGSFRGLANLQDMVQGTTGQLTVEHMVDGNVSLVDTPFEDTVIPASLPHGWGSV